DPPGRQRKHRRHLGEPRDEGTGPSGPQTVGRRQPMSDQTGRFLDGSLSPEEARKLAQESLYDPKLFGELTEAALVKAALNRETVRAPRNIRAKIQLVVIGA